VDQNRRKAKKKKRRKKSSSDERSDEELSVSKTRKQIKAAGLRVSDRALKKILKISKIKKKELGSFDVSGKKFELNKAAEKMEQRASRSEKSLMNTDVKEKSSKTIKKVKVRDEEIRERKKFDRREDEREVRSSKMGSIQVMLNNNSSKQNIPTMAKPSLASTVQEKLLRLAGGVQGKEVERGEERRMKSVKERLGPARRDSYSYSPVRRDRSIARDNKTSASRISEDKKRHHDIKLDLASSRLQSCVKRDELMPKNRSRQIRRSRERGESRSRSRDNQRSIVRKRGSGRGRD